MSNKDIIPTPSQFYRNRRPEFFSDSKTEAKVLLTKEQFAFELSQISTNQKHDSFETFCRRLAEKLITPNLVPQVGPTGGGDGKTDSETYPVSNFVSDRWFISKNKWNENENWAFAISAKRDWKAKVKSDVKKIIETERGYTRTYFFSSQKIRSKDKKDIQDLIKKEYDHELIILDAEWIIENIYNSRLLNLAIESLNLSSIHLEEKIIGPNDSTRIKTLSEIEEKINNTDRTFEVDFQLVEDCLESAILTRMMEQPKTEVVGKFERAIRFVNKTNNLQQKIRILYQLAWTYLNWYDDYKNFYKGFKEFKVLVKKEPNLNNIELYLNLYNLLKMINNIEEVKKSVNINFISDEKDFINLLEKCSKNLIKPTTALLAEFYLSFIRLFKFIDNNKKISKELIKLKGYFEKGKYHLELPFEQLKEMVEIYSRLLPDNKDFDSLIDLIAEIEVTRVSELSSGKIYLNRGSIKLENDLTKESLVFFGKAVRKLAKQEAEDEFYFCLLLLSEAYRKLGLYWAANNCLVSALNISVNEWYTTGSINRRSYKCVEHLLRNEIMIGRIPVLITWYELFNVLELHFDSSELAAGEEIPIKNLIDGCLSTRLLNTEFEDLKELSDLPDILANNDLWLSSDSVLYILGHEDLIETDESKNPSYRQDGFKEIFSNLANQPFKEQIAFKTNLLNKDEINIYTRILGVKISINTQAESDFLILGETILAYLESFLATSFMEAFPISEKVTINIQKEDLDKFFQIETESNSVINLLIRENYDYQSKDIPELMDELVPLVIGKNYFFKDYKDYFTNLYKNDEVYERLAPIIEHKNFVTNILTSKPKFLLKEWKKEHDKHYSLKRNSNPIKVLKTKKDKKTKKGLDFNAATHKDLKAETVIDGPLWDKAKWKAFGFATMPAPIPFGILLLFENEEAGKNIFKNWIKEYGEVDIDEIISVTIIKGIRTDKPFWYKVMISKNVNRKEIKKGGFISLSSRFHRMEAQNAFNLDNLIKRYEYYKEYLLLPAHVDENLRMTPFPELAIRKTKLKVINAWEIGLHDFERAVITPDDKPIIPAHIQNAPILQVLKEMN